MSQQGYVPKDLTFEDEGRQSLISGISKISKAVKSTLGPRGRTVLIESTEHIGGLTVTKDGVTVAQSIFLDHPIENLAIKMMKEAANQTASTAGDGTTTAIVLTEALVLEGKKLLLPEHNITEVIKYINTHTQRVVKYLKKKSKKKKSRVASV